MSEPMWTEKYRPKTLSEVVGHEEVVTRLSSFVKSRNIPHLLFAGRAGVGKTTSILAFIKDLYGDVWRDNYLELNASDTRGIDVIRTTVKNFARHLAFGDIPFKIIILDEADNLTRDAQQALRRTMELFVSTARFCLICNYSSKIIEPIQSRCAIFRFPPLSEKAIKSRLGYIANKEKLKLTDDGLDAILYVSRGDLRRAINMLQAAGATGTSVNDETVYSIAGKAHPEKVQELLKITLEGDFMEARKQLYELLVEYSLSGIDVIRQIHWELFNLDIPDRLKVRLADYVGDVEFRLTEGADTEIQLSALLARIQSLGKNQRD
jgi:replication factor C small subunit